jgi:hypothetical protein
MDFEYVPLLTVQRDLYRLPRGPERFREYLRTLIDKDANDMRLPLTSMNPMGKDHLPVFLDALLAMDADAAGARAVERTRGALAAEPGSFRACLVVADDLMGGWTNRYTSELALLTDQSAFRKRGWVTVNLWTSETYSYPRVEGETAACLFRTAYAQRHGYAKTLGDIIGQETDTAARMREAVPEWDGSESFLDEEEAAYTREILAPLSDHEDTPTLIATLFGDEAAKQLGHAPLGLSRRAGLRLAARGNQNQDLILK